MTDRVRIAVQKNGRLSDESTTVSYTHLRAHET